jgi:LysM repeat protein
VELSRLSRRYEQDVSQKAVWHVVAAGDALSSIATRYGTTEVQLTELNRLSGTTIKIGQRLLIKRGR